MAGAVAGAHPGGGADVPLQQPRRAARAAAGGRGLRHVRAIEHGGARWLVLAGVLVGFAFLTKMLQAFLVVPVLRAASYLLAAPIALRRAALAPAARRRRAGRRRRLVGGGRRAVAGGEPRPYIGGSQTNSVLELILGYNGLGRLTGNETGSVVPAAAAPARRHVGRDRLGPHVRRRVGRPGRLAAAGRAALRGRALVAHAARARAPTALRAAVLLWGGWLLVTGGRLQLRAGHHPRVLRRRSGPGDRRAGRHRGGRALAAPRAASRWRVTLAAVLAATSVWSYVLLARSADWQPWLRPLVLVGRADRGGPRWPRAAGWAAARRRPLAVAGIAGRSGRSGGVLAADGEHRPHRLAADRRTDGRRRARRRVRARRRHKRRVQRVRWPDSPLGGKRCARRLRRTGHARRHAGRHHGRTRLRDRGRLRRSGRLRRGNAGGLLDASTPSAELVALLRTDADRYTWVAAAVGAQIGGRLPARHRSARDEPRRLQRQRPLPEPRPVPGPRERGPRALLHRRRPGRRTVRRRRLVDRARSPHGSSRTTRPRPSAGSPSTTSRARRAPPSRP